MVKRRNRNANEIEEAFSSALPSSGTYTGSKFIWKAWLVKGWAIISGKKCGRPAGRMIARTLLALQKNHVAMFTE